MNWATDGDGTRRIIFYLLMSFLIEGNSKIYPIVSTLRFMDLHVGENDETVDYDGKHLAKRVRNNMISAQFQIAGVVLVRRDIESILSLAEKEKTKHSIEELVNPADKQNVSLATDFLIAFSVAVQKPELKSLGFRIASVSDVLKLLGMVVEGILALYCYITFSVEEQLQHISTAAHSFLVLFREYCDVLPNQLYHDLQATYKNVFFCAAKFKVYHPERPFFIVILGTDPEERLFGNVRLKYKQNGLNALEILYCARALKEMTAVMEQHPEWTKNSSKVMSRLCLDYSKPSSWDVAKLKMENVDVRSCWTKGRLNVENFIQSTTDEKLKWWIFLISLIMLPL